MTSFFRLVPGIGAAAVVASLAYSLRLVPILDIFSPVFLGGLIGLFVRNTVGVSNGFRPGLTFSMRTLLRLGIVLLGVQLQLGQILSMGVEGVFILGSALALTFLFTVWLGGWLGVSRDLTFLVAAGTSICGVSAILAANSVVKGKEEDTTYAVAGITLFGTIFMLIYPLLAGAFENEPKAFGIWAGASIHEIAQVTAATFQVGQESGETGVIAKLTRVALLAPTIFILGWWVNCRLKAQGGEERRSSVPVPWFLIGFICLICVNSIGIIPSEVRMPLGHVTSFLLALALAAMGLETDLRKIIAKGLRPLVLGAGASLFISLFSFVMVKSLL